eukprot:5316188-Pleurochrysis_carterae.AAC.1
MPALSVRSSSSAASRALKSAYALVAAAPDTPCMYLQAGEIQGRGKASPGTQLWPKQQRCSKLRETHLLSKNERSSASLVDAFSTVRSASRGQPQKP